MRNNIRPWFDNGEDSLVMYYPISKETTELPTSNDPPSLPPNLTGGSDVSGIIKRCAEDICVAGAGADGHDERVEKMTTRLYNLVTECVENELEVIECIDNDLDGIVWSHAEGIIKSAFSAGFHIGYSPNSTPDDVEREWERWKKSRTERFTTT